MGAFIGDTSPHCGRFHYGISVIFAHIRDCMRLITIRKQDNNELASLTACRTLLAALCAAVALALCLGASGCRDSAQQPGASTSANETIVVLRHGEKAPDGLGQLNCMGLNRSLALPKVLIGRFGRADAIFSPNPAVQMRENSLSTERY